MRISNLYNNISTNLTFKFIYNKRNQMIGYGTKLISFKDMGINRNEIKEKFDTLNEFYLNRSEMVDDETFSYLQKWGLTDV